jgi:hypothetical protein
MNPTDVQILLTGAADETSKRLVARLSLADIDNTYQLIASVYRLAIRDAKRGDVGATIFLDLTAPGWQALSAQHQTERTQRGRRRATQKQAT